MKLRLSLLIMLLLMVSCGGPDLGPTRYAQNRGVDGFTVFRQLLAAQHTLAPVQGYGDQLRDAQRVVYLHRHNTIPDDAFWWWMRNWLEGDSERQALVILRDVGTIDLMLERWARQAYSLSFSQETEEQGRRLEMLSELLFRMAKRLKPNPPLEADERVDRAGFHWRGIAAQRPFRLIIEKDRESLSVPRYLRQAQVLDYFHETTHAHWHESGHTFSPPTTSRIRSRDKEEEVTIDPWTPLITSDLGTLLGRWQSPDGGQLYILNGASGITDAALVEPAARDLLAALFASWDDGIQRDRLAWLLHASPDSDTAATFPGPLTALRHPGVAIVTVHSVLFILALLTWRSLWVGRRRYDEERTVVSFDRHIVSVGRLLDSEDGRHLAAHELATWFKQPAPTASDDPQQDLRTVRAWFPDTPSSSSPAQGTRDD